MKNNIFDYSSQLEDELITEIYESKRDDAVFDYELLSLRVKTACENYYKSELEIQLNEFRVKKGCLTK